MKVKEKMDVTILYEYIIAWERGYVKKNIANLLKILKRYYMKKHPNFIGCEGVRVGKLGD